MKTGKELIDTLFDGLTTPEVTVNGTIDPLDKNNVEICIDFGGSEYNILKFLFNKENINANLKKTTGIYISCKEKNGKSYEKRRVSITNDMEFKKLCGNLGKIPPDVNEIGDMFPF